MSHQDDTLREEGSAFGQRVKGAVKDAAGAVHRRSRART